MVEDRCIVCIKVDYEVVYALSNGDIADDLEWPLTILISTFCIAFDNFVAGYTELQIWYVGWTQQVLAYRWQTVPEIGN